VSAYGERESEHVLLEEVRRAERGYREAVALSQAMAEDCGRTLPFRHAAGDRGEREIAKVEAALERYRNAVKDFSDLVLYGRRPDGQSESRSRDRLTSGRNQYDSQRV
jgi:hypothetical protein